MRLTGARAVGAIVVLAASLAGLTAPPPALADTGSSIPFRDYIGDADSALYRLDRKRSSWAVNLVSSVPPAFTEPCAVTGTFVFVRIDAFRGVWPQTMRTVVKATSEDCTWFGEVPTGRWILVGDAARADWWGFGPSGKMEAWGAGAGGPVDTPPTLAGWIAALRTPDTATHASGGGRGTAAAGSLILTLGAAGGLLVGLRRWRPRRSPR